MKYILSFEKPHRHYLDIEFIADLPAEQAGEIKSDETIIQLPAWRPGRYELGNFAKNVQRWGAYDAKGNALKFEKITKDSWKVQTKGVTELHIKYNYYSVDLNAGSTFLNDEQLYVNPVNCCVYIPERINDACELNLLLPEDYRVAIGLESKKDTKNVYITKDFHELADSPFIASNSLQHETYRVAETIFHLWFQGECKPHYEKLIHDFTKYCKEQLAIYKHAPFKEYHFLFQILPVRFYHGVEHTTNTVIALGPGYNLMKGDLYEDLLGVSCHELFHAWNIKTIRPAEMHPYDYTKENYSKLGYVCEGVTTYYGDYLLYRSKVYNDEQYWRSFEERIQKHFDNFGRYNLSVADSSFDTWLDGYTPGIPNRKTSIYDEGCLLAFVTDVFIRRNSNNKYSLDDVMLYLYNEFGRKGKGYSDKDYKGVVEHFANTSFDALFNNYINSAADYSEILSEALDYIGCKLDKVPNLFYQHALGLKVQEVAGLTKVMSVYPASVADLAGIAVNDDIISINNMLLRPDSTGTNFSEWCTFFANIPLKLTVNSNYKTKEVNLIPKPNSYFKTNKVVKLNDASETKRTNYELWSKNKF